MKDTLTNGQLIATPNANVTPEQQAAAKAAGFNPVAAPSLADRYKSTTIGGSNISPSSTSGLAAGQDYGYHFDGSGNQVWTDKNGNPTGRVTAPAPNEADIRTKYRGFAQASIDAIKSQFDKYISDDTTAKKQLTTKAYLRNLASGLSGAPSGAANETKAADQGDKRIRQDVEEMTTRINAALANADARGSQEFEQRRSEYLASAKDKAAANETFNNKIKTEAENEIAAYAANMSYDDWAKKVGTPKVQQYMNETGLDATGLQALFLKNAKNDLLDANGTKLSDGSVVYLKKVYDANGNLTGTKEVGRVSAPNGKTIKDSRITDNGIQILYTDGTYETRGTPGNSSSSGSTAKITGTPTGFTEGDIEQGRALFKKFGKDGYAEPAFYVDAYQNWINKGGKASKFLELYPPDEFVNPNEADLLPTYLQPKKAKAPVASTTGTPAATGGRTY